MHQVQEYLRHADISTSVNTYGHLDIRDRTITGNQLCKILIHKPDNAIILEVLLEMVLFAFQNGIKKY